LAKAYLTHNFFIPYYVGWGFHLTIISKMNKYRNHTQELIDKYLHGRANKDEIAQLNSWYHSFDDSKIELENQSYEDMMNLKKSMLSKVKNNPDGVRTKSNYSSLIWKVAASIAIVLGVVLAIQHYSSFPVEIVEVAFVEKSNPIGRKSTIILPDGSKVKLNSDSKIRYAKGFLNGHREVILEGEAFFEVKKDSQRPFVVRTRDVSTTVLGTSFNVNAYAQSDQIEVAVVTGKVEVKKTAYYNSDAESIAYLTPNMKATYQRSERTITTNSFNMEETIGWRNGILVFKNANQKDIAVKLKRWYGIDLEIEGNKEIISKRYTGKFDNNSLEYVLKAISYTSNIRFEIENNRVILKQK